MKNLSRRLFLRGQWTAREPNSSRSGTIDSTQSPDRGTSKSTLPPIVSWLSNYGEKTDPPRRDHLAANCTIPILRPPGAVDESLFLQQCTRCNECIEACPHGTIRQAPAQFRGAAGTPYIEPSAMPCWRCEDLPCIEACGEGALVGGALQMGTAQISHFDCLNALGTQCNTCVERCPLTGAIAPQGGGSPKPPTVDPELCEGCGVCQYVCPAPMNAILILPKRVQGHEYESEEGP